MTLASRGIAAGGPYLPILSLLIGFLSTLRLKVSNARYILYIILVMLLLILSDGVKI